MAAAAAIHAKRWGSQRAVLVGRVGPVPVPAARWLQGSFLCETRWLRGSLLREIRWRQGWLLREIRWLQGWLPRQAGSELVPDNADGSLIGALDMLTSGLPPMPQDGKEGPAMESKITSKYHVTIPRAFVTS